MSYKGKIYINDVGSNKNILTLLQYLVINRNNQISYDNITYAMGLKEENKNSSAFNGISSGLEIEEANRNGRLFY